LRAPPATAARRHPGGKRAIHVDVRRFAARPIAEARQEKRDAVVSTGATHRTDNARNFRRSARSVSGSASGIAMTQSKTSEELYNERRRRHAAELIAAVVRKRRRITTDESLLDQEALRAAAERALRDDEPERR
jgi:hypothetical protein